MKNFEQTIKNLLDGIDIRINGNRPWDIQVYNEAFYERVILQGSLGLGEAYMDRWWDVESLDDFFARTLSADLQNKIALAPPHVWANVRAFFRNLQNPARAFEVGERHYDIGNDLYEAMLDKRMVYTCGYWLDGVDSLDKAQETKLDYVCRALGLEPGQRVLDIGCGWGSFACYAAEKYEVEVVGITVSKEQKKLAEKRCKGLPVEIRLQDYREISASFDCIVSLGMLEHVGNKNYRTYMKIVSRCLSDDGTFVLHTIGSGRSVNNTDPWIGKYIFPNSMIPSIRQVGLAMEGLLVMEEWENFGSHYDRTVMAWYDNIQKHWKSLKEHYSERFFRMWKYYLMCSAGSFRARKNHQWHIKLTRQKRHPSI